MRTINLHPLPFFFHVVLETPAAVAFALFPSATLRSPQLDAHAVIRQYALSLFSTILIAASFAFWPHDLPALDPHVHRLERQVAGALALYHIGPMARAGYRIWYREGQSYRIPCLHLLSHGAGGMTLAGRAYGIW